MISNRAGQITHGEQEDAPKPASPGGSWLPGVSATKVMNCPVCKCTNIEGRGKRHALYPAGIVAIVGLPFAMLHQAAAPELHHCLGCGHDFTRRTLSARIAQVALVVLIVALGVIMVIAIASAVLSANR